MATRSALVLYGTETGNAQDIAYELGQSLQRHYFQVKTRELDSTTLQDLTRPDLVIFALSTTGQGDFPSNSRKFWLSLLKKRLTAVSLENVSYALVGLCDSSYPKFNLAARKLHKRLIQLGASALLQPCEADEQGEDGTEGAFLAWLSLFEERILKSYPLPEDQTPIPPGEHLPSQWTLIESEKSNGMINGHENAPKVCETSPERSFEVIIEQNTRVTPQSHWQDVRLINFRSEKPIQYLPGDAIAIRPENSSDDVDELIGLQDWQEFADRKLMLHSNQSSQDDFGTVLSAHQTYTLRELLTKFLDINSIPRRSFFAKIAHFTEDDMQKDRALEFTNPEFLDEYFDYATRPRRSILEVLQEFNTVRIPWQEVISVFPLLRSRQFSVASGGKAKGDGHSFDLLVAIVRYRTVIKRIRQGVCTRYLAKLAPGTKLQVRFHPEGRFHDLASLGQNHLLVGGGTGIAPLRALIQEKEQSFPDSRSTLIFGCRNRDADFFFGDEWQDRDQLKIITAFSRDQQSKVYVQDRIKAYASLVRAIIKDENSTIVVCGSSGAMPKAVREALKEALIDDETDDSAAESILTRLEKTARYKQETW